MVKGDLGVNYVEKDYDSNNITNNRTLICLVAPFKDDSFRLKGYVNIKTALEEQKTDVPEAVGYRYLQILDELGVKEIVIFNVTTSTGTPEAPTYDYDISDTKLAEILSELDDAIYNILALPFELTETQKDMYKSFWENKKAKMEGNGAFVPLEPNNDGSNIPTFSETFKDGGIYGIVTTPIQLINSSVPLSLPESTVYLAGVVSNMGENDKVSMMTLNGVIEPVTKEVYNDDVYQACIMNGAIATKYKDSVRKIIAIANANTPTDNDLMIERVYHLIMNELREKMEDTIGDRNNEKIKYPQFQGMCISIREKYKGLDYITDLKWSVSKSGSPSVDVHMKVNEDNIIGTINVFGQLEVN